MIRSVVFPIAGVGSRLYPLTKTIPKHMLEVLGRPLIYYAMQEARNAGIENLIFIVNHLDKTTTKYLKQIEPNSTIIYDEANGLGHAIWKARDAIDTSPFAVILADDLITHRTSCLTQMLKHYVKLPRNMLAVHPVQPKKSQLYGIITGNREGDILQINTIQEKPCDVGEKPSLAVVGRYILQYTIFNYLENDIHKLGKQHNEIGITNALSNSLLNEKFYAIQFRGKWYDCGSKEGLYTARSQFSEPLSQLDL